MTAWRKRGRNEADTSDASGPRSIRPMMKFAWTGVLLNSDGARSPAISALSGWLPKVCASETSMVCWQ